MSRPGLLFLCFCLVLFHGLLASRSESLHDRQQRGKCEIDNFLALEPNNRVRCEAGLVESWDYNDDQFQCIGVTMVRYTIEPKGLLLPSYSNAPILRYIVEGTGLLGSVAPGCPETAQSTKEPRKAQQKMTQSTQDEHQKIRRINQGDIVALTTGVVYWVHNDDKEKNLVVVSLVHIESTQNQLDSMPRKFYLAGNPQGAFRDQQDPNNVFSPLDVVTLAKVFNVNKEVATRLLSVNDTRNNIVRMDVIVEGMKPQWDAVDGLEDNLCAMSNIENIGDPLGADISTPQVGWLSIVNSYNLPILDSIQLSAMKGVLYNNSMMAPHYNLNAHSILYVIRGSARMQVADNHGAAVFDGEVTEGQVVTVPQNFVAVWRTEKHGFEWVEFKTNGNARMIPLAGKTSVMAGLPVGVIASAYRVSPEEARALKYNRTETLLFKCSQSSSSSK